MVHGPVATPAYWEAARQRHADDPASHESRLYAACFAAAVEAAAAAPVRDSEVRVVKTGELLCSDVCTALLIQRLIAPGASVSPQVLVRYLASNTIDLGTHRLVLLSQPAVNRYRCVVDRTVIDADGAHFDTSADLWTSANSVAETRFLTDARPVAYLTRTGEILLASELTPIKSTVDLASYLRIPPGERI